MFLTFLKIGAVLYGSGYTLLAFIEADFVQRLGWLTSAQVIDAVAVGQVTPGPLLTTATFIGYLLGGVPGAVLATAGVFLPAFVIVSIIGPFIPRLRGSPWAAGFLDGVNAAALGLMAAVTVRLGLAALVDPVTIGVGVIAAVLLVRFNTNTTWLILGAGLIGLGRMLLLG
jgi:chromate transporter